MWCHSVASAKLVLQSTDFRPGSDICGHVEVDGSPSAYHRIEVRLICSARVCTLSKESSGPAIADEFGAYGHDYYLPAIKILHFASAPLWPEHGSSHIVRDTDGIRLPFRLRIPKHQASCSCGRHQGLVPMPASYDGSLKCLSCAEIKYEVKLETVRHGCMGRVKQTTIPIRVSSPQPRTSLPAYQPMLSASKRFGQARQSQLQLSAHLPAAKGDPISFDVSWIMPDGDATQPKVTIRLIRHIRPTSGHRDSDAASYEVFDQELGRVKLGQAVASEETGMHTAHGILSVPNDAVQLTTCLFEISYSLRCSLSFSPERSNTLKQLFAPSVCETIGLDLPLFLPAFD